MNFMTPQVGPRMFTSAKRITSMKARLALLCVLFVFAQIQGLTHAHDGDLNFTADCDICLKLSSGDDVLVSADAALPVQTSQQSVARFASASPVVELVKLQRSRAPPIT